MPFDTGLLVSDVEHNIFVLDLINSQSFLKGTARHSSNTPQRKTLAQTYKKKNFHPTTPNATLPKHLNTSPNLPPHPKKDTKMLPGSYRRSAFGRSGIQGPSVARLAAASRRRDAHRGLRLAVPGGRRHRCPGFALEMMLSISGQQVRTTKLLVHFWGVKMF